MTCISILDKWFERMKGKVSRATLITIKINSLNFSKLGKYKRKVYLRTSRGFLTVNWRTILSRVLKTTGFNGLCNENQDNGIK